MCVAYFFYDSLPEYLLLLAFNRDEDVHRAARHTHWWEDFEGCLLGGRDEAAGGTWLCCGVNGRVAFLTNYRENPALSRSLTGSCPTRGSLPVNFVANKATYTATPSEYLSNIQNNEYAGYNIIVADFNQNNSRHADTNEPLMMYYSNRTKQGPQPIHPGFHSITNGPLDAPNWPKMEKGRELFQLLEASGKLDSKEPPWQDIFDIMNNSEPLAGNDEEDDSDLPQTGYGNDFERRASAICIKPFLTRWGNYFGTRSQTVLAVRRDGTAALRERYLIQGESSSAWQEQEYTFTMNVAYCTKNN